MRYYLFCFGIFLCPPVVLSQPYFDVAGISLWHLPGSTNKNDISESQGYLFVSLPVSIGKQSKLVVSPSYENRFLETQNDNTLQLKSLTLPVAVRYQTIDSAWTFLAVGIVRSNSTQFRFTGEVFQVAGAVVCNYKINTALTLKAGVYLSKEFYGDFFMFLAGVEWQINERLNLFGFVNSNIRLEYRLTKKLYGGIAFKSSNNSYRMNGEGGYYKLFDNHLGIYADIPVGKKIIWNVEAGHTVLRYIKGRNGADFPEINSDGFIFKTGFAYRIRL